MQRLIAIRFEQLQVAIIDARRYGAHPIMRIGANWCEMGRKWHEMVGNPVFNSNYCCNIRWIRTAYFGITASVALRGLPGSLRLYRLGYCYA